MRQYVSVVSVFLVRIKASAMGRSIVKGSYAECVYVCLFMRECALLNVFKYDLNYIYLKRVGRGRSE